MWSFLDRFQLWIVRVVTFATMAASLMLNISFSLSHWGQKNKHIATSPSHSIVVQREEKAGRTIRCKSQDLIRQNDGSSPDCVLHSHTQFRFIIKRWSTKQTEALSIFGWWATETVCTCLAAPRCQMRCALKLHVCKVK
jgi:hypothetical protein